MTPGSWTLPQPEPLPLPAPVWLLWGLLMLTFVLHVLAMNVLVGGSVMAAYFRVRGRADAYARAAITRFSRAAPVLVAATVTLGVAPLLFLQVLYGRLFFVSSILMAWLWLAIVPGLMIVYAGTYVLAFRSQALRQLPSWWHLVIVGLLAAIAFVYTSNMTLMLRADQFRALYEASSAGFHLNLTDPTLWARWIHMMLGAVAVAGLVLALYGASRSAAEPDAAAWMWRTGIAWSAAATALNVLAGFWWALRLPMFALQRLTMPGVPGALFVVSVFAGVMTAMLLVVLARRDASRVAAWIAGLAMLVTMTTMIGVRDQIRAAALDRAGFVPVQWVLTQWTPIALFVILLITALALVGWMAYVLHRAFTVAPSQLPDVVLPRAS
jgi:hypothetical protein